MGYLFGKKGFRVYYLESGEYFISGGVVFSKTVFPYAAGSEIFSVLVLGRADVVIVDHDESLLITLKNNVRG